MEFEKRAADTYRLELTRYNLEVLLAKLDDPYSLKTLEKQGKTGEYVSVVAVENEAHYSDRRPGPVYMPGSGETL